MKRFGDGWFQERQRDAQIWSEFLGPEPLRRRPSARLRSPELERAEPEASDAEQDVDPRPSVAAACARDVAVSDQMALLITRQAPLPLTTEEARRVAGNNQALYDYKSVATIVPAVPETRLLIFFHGNNNYVTIAPNGDVPASVDPSRHSRVPHWVPRDVRGVVRAKKAAPLAYRFDALRASQAGLSPDSAFTELDIKDPVVLLPEDVELRTGRYWSVPPADQYGTSRDGTPTGPGTTRLQELVSECYEHLRCLRNPSGRPYLDPQMTSPASWAGNIRRLYVSGHSGGGKPLVNAAGADMVMSTATSALGQRGRAAEFHLYDCTYGFGIHNYVNLCTNWKNAGLLARRPDGARLVCVYRPGAPGSDTESEADELRGRIARVMQVPASTLLKLHDSADMSSASMTQVVIPALTSLPVVFVRTRVAHDDIPTRFAPLLLRTAAS